MRLINGVLAILVLVFDVWYMVSDVFVTKYVASSLFVVIAMINFFYAKNHGIRMAYPKWMIGGLILSFLGDVAIVHFFVLGALFFAMAHLCYFFAYTVLEPLVKRDIRSGILIAVLAILGILLAPNLSFPNPMLRLGWCSYAVLLSLMVGKAVGNYIRHSSHLNRVILVGSMLFFFSDAMLLLKVAGCLAWANYACLITYYLAQLILAYSMVLYTAEESHG